MKVIYTLPAEKLNQMTPEEIKFSIRSQGQAIPSPLNDSQISNAAAFIKAVEKQARVVTWHEIASISSSCSTHESFTAQLKLLKETGELPQSAAFYVDHPEQVPALRHRLSINQA